MGVLTLEDFRDDLRFDCGGISATSPAWSNARLNRIINATYLWCCMPNHYRHPELEVTEYITLVANTAQYTPTNTYYMIYSISHCDAATASVTGETRRDKLDPMDMREQATILRTARPPREYGYWGGDLYLAGVPDTASTGQCLELRGYRQPPVLAADSAVTLLKSEWDEVISTGAEWRLWKKLQQHDNAYEAKQNFGALVNEIADFRRLHAEEWGWQPSNASPPYMRSD